MHLNAEASNASHTLTDEQCKEMSDFILSDNFKPILSALDGDQSRVEEREIVTKLEEEMVRLRAEEGKLYVMGWMGGVEEDDVTPMPDLPVNPQTLVEMQRMRNEDPVVDTEDWPNSRISSHIKLLMKMAEHHSRYMHNTQWQLNTLNSIASRTKNDSGGGPTKEDMIAKYPWLAECGDHVWTVPNRNPKSILHLSRGGGGDDRSHREHREQRDKAFVKIKPYWCSKSKGGRGLTFSKMPIAVKIALVDDMAWGPCFWSAHITTVRSESKISSDRCNSKKRVCALPWFVVVLFAVTNTQTHLSHPHLCN